MRTQVHFIQNVLAFGLKRKDVLLKTPLRFSSSVKELKCTENSCQFEDKFLTKLTG